MQPNDWLVLIFKLSGLALVFLAFYLELIEHPLMWLWAGLSLLVGLAILRDD